MTRPVLSLAMAGLLLSGCAQFSLDGGMDDVRSGVRQEIGKDVIKIADADAAQRAREQVDALLREPLTTESAVQIALLNNRGLQAAFNDLGLSEAAYVQASLPANPGISLSRYAGGGTSEAEFRLIGNILSLLTLQRRTDLAARQFEQARYRALEATLRLAADTRRSYVRAIAAQQRIGLLEQARFAADAAARLMIKLGESGGANKLDQARVAAFYAELSGQLAQARLKAGGEREALTRRLGLWGSDLAFQLPARLDGLPRTPDAIADVEVEAVRRRVDLIIARHDIVTLAKSFKLTEATRYVSLLQLSGIVNNETATETTADGTRNTGSTRFGLDLEIQIPIFDTGEARLRTARETYMRAVNRLAEKSVNARSEARVAYTTYRATYDIAQHYQGRVLPLRQIISNEVLLRYNGMLVDVFELLIDARERIAANVTALDALRDFNLAIADLQAALTIGGGGSAAGGDEAIPLSGPAPAH